MIFNKNQTVELLPIFGNFETAKHNKGLVLSDKFYLSSDDYDNVSYINWFNSIQGKFNNVVLISTKSIADEMAINAKNNSQVKIKIDSNIK